MLTVLSSPVFCCSMWRGKKKKSCCVCGPENNWTVPSAVLSAWQWESTVLALKAFHMGVWMSVCVWPASCVLRVLRKTSPELFPAVGFLLLGEANAFLPLFADNQIREFRRSLAELLLCAFSLAFVIWWLPPVLSHLAVRLCCTAQLLHR